MIKLIMTDMDGTLLDENCNLPQNFDRVMTKLKEHNILFAPASGRQYYGLLRQLKKYEDSFVFIAENGSYVVYKGEEVFSSTMKKAEVKAMLDIAAKIPQVQVVLCGKKSAYILSDKDKVFFDEISKYYARCQVVDCFENVEDDVLKIAICDLSEAGAEFNAYPYFEKYKDNYQVAISGKLWMDVMKYNTNKGVASRHIQEKFNLKPNECMAFGDYMNDFELLNSVYYSYAMENAHPKIKEIARFQAKSNREAGVLVAIEEMLEQLDKA